MVVCRFYQQGNCKFGANCRYEHPGANPPQNANPFSLLGTASSANSNTIMSSRGALGDRPANSTFSLTKDQIHKDLTEDRPSWIFSAYGPGRDAPEQLFGGYPHEQSFEEMRLHYEQAAASGNAQGALSEIQSLYNTAQQKLQTAMSNIDGAFQFIMNAEHQHPNRHDVCQNNSSPGTGEFCVGKRPVGLPLSQPANAFSTATAATGSPFGQASGGSTFGQPSSMMAGRFAQPLALGGSTLGAPSPMSLGTTATSGFGQTSTLGQKANPFGTPAFGQPALPAQTAGSGFGQTSQLGSKPNPFAALTNKGPSPFASLGGGGGAANGSNATAANPFSQAQGNNQQQPGANPFGQPAAAPSNPFALAQQPASGDMSMDTFSTPSAPARPFGQPANPFAQAAPAQGAQAANPFSQAAAAGNNNNTTSALNAAAAKPASNPYALGASRQHPPLESYAAKSQGRLQAWKGKPVVMRANPEKDDAGNPLAPIPGVQGGAGGSSWIKIWFPDGPPGYNKDTEPDRQYTEKEKAAWQQYTQTGRLELGAMPEAPPLREWCTWDF